MQLSKWETPAQVSSREFCKILKNIFITELVQVAASVLLTLKMYAYKLSLLVIIYFHTKHFSKESYAALLVPVSSMVTLVSLKWLFTNVKHLINCLQCNIWFTPGNLHFDLPYPKISMIFSSLKRGTSTSGNIFIYLYFPMSFKSIMTSTISTWLKHF